MACGYGGPAQEGRPWKRGNSFQTDLGTDERVDVGSDCSQPGPLLSLDFCDLPSSFGLGLELFRPVRAFQQLGGRQLPDRQWGQVFLLWEFRSCPPLPGPARASSLFTNAQAKAALSAGIAALRWEGGVWALKAYLSRRASAAAA